MADQLQITPVVMAARPSRPEARFAGGLVLEAVLLEVADWGLATAPIVVFDRGTEHLMTEARLGDAVVVVDEGGSGPSSALSVALDAVSQLFPDANAALVVDGDVPMVPPHAITALAGAMTKAEALAAAPTYRYVRGGPVLLARQLWDRVKAMDGDQRLEELLAAHPEWTTPVVISAPAPQPVA